MNSVSLVVITRNAEAHISRCLSSVPFASDIVVVDSGSTDKTVVLAKEHGARVFHEEWRGFGPQKRRATELAKTDWILNLDADEALSPKSQEEIKALLNMDLSSHEAFSFPRLSFHLGRWIRHGGWYPDRQVRLYNRTKANWTEAVLHERISAHTIEKLNQPILHWVFTDLADQVATNNRYSGLGTEKLHASGRKFSLAQLIISPAFKFLETYVWKRGFLDGLPGFIIAVGAAHSMFLKWAKLWELERAQQKK